MPIRIERIETHWNYFLAIERDLEVLSRYIEFNQDNVNCYSIEIARTLMAAAAEVDVVCKQICGALDPNSSADGIVAYRDKIMVSIPAVATFEVLIPRYGLTLTPWAKLAERRSPAVLVDGI